MKKLFSLLLTGVLLLTGCTFSIPEDLAVTVAPQETTSPSIGNSVMVDIENAEGTIVLTVNDNETFAGMSASITGSSITQDNGSIIDSIHSVADWGPGANDAYFFDGSYIVTGSNLDQSRFCFETTSSQWYDPLSCGINFYDLIMTAEGFAYSKASLVYSKEISVSGAEGTVSFIILPLSKEQKNAFTVNLFAFSCTANADTDIVLTWNGTNFEVNASKNISDCVSMIETDTQKLSVSSDAPGTSFTITIGETPKIIAAD